MSQRSSLWVDLCPLFVSQRESRSRKQSGGLASSQRRTMLLILLGYRFVSFQASQKSINFYWDVTLASCSIRYVDCHARIESGEVDFTIGLCFSV